MANTAKVVKLLKQAIELLSDEEGTEVSMPEPKAVKKLDKAGLLEVAEAFGIDVEGKKEVAIRALVMTASQIVHEEDTDELEKTEVNALCAAVGLSPSKKLEATLEGLKEYFDAAADSEDGDESEEEEESEDEEEESEEEEEESEDEEEEEEEEEDSPKKKKKKTDDEEEEEEEEEDEEESEDEEEEEEEESEDEDEEEESEEEEEEEVSPKEQKKRLAAYNKVAKKPLKNYAALAKLLVDEDDNAVAWGEAYVKGDEAFCCGLPLKDVKVGGKQMGKCVVTGKIFYQDKKGDLVEHEK